MNLSKRLSWSATALVGFGAILWLVVAFFPQPPTRLPSGHFAPRFRIGKDTTYITEPIDEEGFPDYEEALNRHFSMGVKPEENRMVGMLKAFGPKQPVSYEPFSSRFYEWVGAQRPPDEGAYFIALEDYLKKNTSLSDKEQMVMVYMTCKVCETRPWKKEDHPQIAAWIDKNQRPLNEAILASQKSQYFYPALDASKGGDFGELRNLTLLLIYGERDLISLICCKAMLEVEKKDFPAARKTLLNGLNLVHSFRPHFTADLIELTQQEQALYAGLHVLIEKASFSTVELESLQQAIEAVAPFPPVADLLDFGDRLVMLNKAVLANKIGAKNIDYIMNSGPDSSISKEEYDERIQTLANNTSYNSNLKLINQCIDKTVAIMRMANPRARRESLMDFKTQYRKRVDSAIAVLAGESKSWLPGPFSLRADMSMIGLKLADQSIYDPLQAQQRAEETEETKRLFFTSLALAKFRLETGKYPETLEELAPRYLKAIPEDLFAERSPRYGKTPEGGYLLYSIGMDRLDSGGRERREDGESDDIAVKVPLPPLLTSKPARR